MIFGGMTFAGGAGETIPVASDSAVAEPALLDAVTSTPSRYETSELETRYVAPVAPLIGSQLLVVHRSH